MIVNQELKSVRNEVGLVRGLLVDSSNDGV